MPDRDLDSLDVASAMAALGDQIADAGEAALAAQLPDVVPQGLLMMGMGGSGVGAEVVAGIAGPTLAVPLVIAKGCDVPRYVGPGWLAITVSVSGETEETLAATRVAADRGVPLVAVTSGGALARLVEATGGTVVRVTAKVPKPRFAFGAVATIPLVLVDRLGLVGEGVIDVPAAADQARRRADGTASVALAEVVGEREPLFYGGDALGAAAAYRARCDMNENAKRRAFSATVPELCHNEVCALAASQDRAIVMLRTGLESAPVAKQMRAVGELAAGFGVPVVDVHAEGDGPFARLVDLVSITQWMSYRLALAAGVDPGPIEAITQLKAASADG